MSILDRAVRRSREDRGSVRSSGSVRLGASVPALGLFALIEVLELALAVVAYPLSAGIAVGVVLALASPWTPQRLGPWLAILILGLGQFTRHGGLGWRVLVLLAGLHLLHVAGSLALQLPWRSRLKLRVLSLPLRRFVTIQLPTQVAAALVLGLLAPDGYDHRPLSWPALAVVGAVALAGLALLLLRPWLSPRAGRGGDA